MALKRTPLTGLLLTRDRSASAGFTFIEILVVTILIGVLATIVMVSFVSTGEFTRDARRKKDLAALQAALEVYKLNNGEYPNHSLCNSTATWPGCRTPWIPGLNEEYVSQLPRDPRQNITGFIGNTNTETYTYNYIRVSATDYRLLTRLENENDTDLNGAQYGYTGEAIYVVLPPR